MGAIAVPAIRTRKMRETDVKEIERIIFELRHTASREVLDLLKDKCPWAHDIVVDANSRPPSAKQKLVAIRRFELAELELTRQAALETSVYGDFSEFLPADVTTALKAPLDFQSVDFNHRKGVIDGLYRLQRYERDLKGTSDEELDKKRDNANRSNRSKGKKARKAATPKAA